MSLTERINFMRLELQCAKPRSRRRIELELRLRDLVVEQLKRETRKPRRRAA